MSQMDEYKDRLFAILQCSPDAVTITDLSGTIIDCSDSMARYHGYGSREEIKGKSAYDLVVPEERDMVTEALNSIVAAGGIRDWEFTLRRRDGSAFYAEI